MAKSQLQKFKEELVKTIREDFQGEYGLCEDGVTSFFEAMGLTEIDEAQAKVVTITFPYRGDIQASEVKRFVESYDFRYGVSIDSSVDKATVVIQ